jgi:hypothetical protein
VTSVFVTFVNWELVPSLPAADGSTLGVSAAFTKKGELVAIYNRRISLSASLIRVRMM